MFEFVLALDVWHSWPKKTVGYGRPNSARRTMGIHDQESRAVNLAELPRHDGLRRLVQHLKLYYTTANRRVGSGRQLRRFDWIDFTTLTNSVVAFLRKSPPLGDEIDWHLS